MWQSHRHSVLVSTTNPAFQTRVRFGETELKTRMLGFDAADMGIWRCSIIIYFFLSAPVSHRTFCMSVCESTLTSGKRERHSGKFLCRTEAVAICLHTISQLLTIKKGKEMSGTALSTILAGPICAYIWSYTSVVRSGGGPAAIPGELPVTRSYPWGSYLCCQDISMQLSFRTVFRFLRMGRTSSTCNI